jgi:O-antigen/teichoic acid export membrane protein
VPVQGPLLSHGSPGVTLEQTKRAAEVAEVEAGKVAGTDKPSRIEEGSPIDLSVGLRPNEDALPSMTRNAETYFEHHEERNESIELGPPALRGGVISVTMQYGNAALQIVSAIVLARLLEPEDFGLVAIITILTSCAPSLIDFGLGDAAVQRIKITQSQVSSLFWLSSGIGLSIAAVVTACAPLIAWIFREPRLEAIAIYYSASFILCGLSIQHLALLRRKMQFAAVSKLAILGSLAGFATALVAAVCGYGYWALVVRPIASALSIAIGAWYLCPWRPGFPIFDSEVTSMVRFGRHVVSFLLLNSIARALDRIALGFFYRPEVVGYFQNAVSLYDSYFSPLSQLHNVASATFSKLQSNPAALRQKYETALSVLSFFVMPAAATLSVTGRDVTTQLLGEKWQAAGLLLGILALRGISQVVEWSQGWLHLAIGRADRWRNWGIVTFGVHIAAVLAGLPFGPTGIAAANVIASFLCAIPSVSYAGRPIGIGAALVIRATGRQWAGAIMSAAGGWWAQATILVGFSGVSRIILSAGICIIIYLVIVIGLFRLVQPISVLVKVVQNQLSRHQRV